MLEGRTVNALQTLLVAATVIVAGAGPLVAVHIGGKAFDADQPEPPEPDPPEPEPDDTIELPPITGRHRC
jgi:hypothetical protein